MDKVSITDQEQRARSSIRTFAITVGIVIVLLVIAVIVVALALTGPEVGTLYSNIVPSL